MRSAPTDNEKKGRLNVARSMFSLSRLMIFCVAAALLAAAQSPTLTSISKVSTQQYQTIALKGMDLGTSPPYNGDSDYLSFWDVTRGWEAGYATDGDLIGLIVNSWQGTRAC